MDMNNFFDMLLMFFWFSYFDASIPSHTLRKIRLPTGFNSDLQQQMQCVAPHQYLVLSMAIAGTDLLEVPTI